MDVYQPALRIRVMSNATTPVLGGHVRATLNETSSCAGDTLVGLRANALAGLTTYGVAGDPKAGYITRAPVPAPTTRASRTATGRSAPTTASARTP